MAIRKATPLAAVFALSLFLPAAASAADESPQAQVERIRAEAKALREAADARYERAEPACHARFRVNACLAEAKEERLETVRRARTLEIEANRIEIAERQRELAGREPRSAPPPKAGQPAEPARAPELILRERDEAGARRAAEAEQERSRRDADKAQARAQAEARAAERAAETERRRQRYDERIREYEERQAEKR